MQGASQRQVRTTKTKSVFNVFIDGNDTGYIAKEVFSSGVVKYYPYYINRQDKPERRFKNIKYIGTQDGRIPKQGFTTNERKGSGFTSAQGVSGVFRYIDKNPNGIQAIVFNDKKTHIDGKGVLHLSFKDFGRIRLRTAALSNSKKDEEIVMIKNILNDLLPASYKSGDKLVYFPGNVQRFFGKYAADTISISDEEAILLKSILLNSDASTEMIIETRQEADRVYIEDVLKQFKELMKFKHDTPNLEEKWHQFFKTHAWIFSQVFAYPAVFIDDKFNVGGRDLTGGTDKIVDFLYKNELTNNVAFIEIKTHKTKLVNNTPYRKPDIYSMSNDLTGSIVQVIDQKTKFLKNFHAKKGSADIDSLNSTCLVIAGDTKGIKSKHKIDSFEMFRLSNKEVVIVTFDEVLKKITTLLDLFTLKK